MRPEFTYRGWYVGILPAVYGSWLPFIQWRRRAFSQYHYRIFWLRWAVLFGRPV